MSCSRWDHRQHQSLSSSLPLIQSNSKGAVTKGIIRKHVMQDIGSARKGSREYGQYNLLQLPVELLPCPRRAGTPKSPDSGTSWSGECHDESQKESSQARRDACPDAEASQLGRKILQTHVNPPRSKDVFPTCQTDWPAVSKL